MLRKIFNSIFGIHSPSRWGHGNKMLYKKMKEAKKIYKKIYKELYKEY